MDGLIVIVLFIVFCYFLYKWFTKPKLKLIGRLNLASNRNHEKSKDYILLRNYVKKNEKELRKTRATSIEDAIDDLVKTIAGGEFLKNVKIYSVNNKYYTIEGDVWGFQQKRQYNGFSIGSKVQYKNLTGQGKIGIIRGFKSSNVCIISDEFSDTTIEISFDNLTRVDHE
jgi:hypothetical protein